MLVVIWSISNNSLSRPTIYGGKEEHREHLSNHKIDQVSNFSKLDCVLLCAFVTTQAEVLGLRHLKRGRMELEGFCRSLQQLSDDDDDDDRNPGWLVV